MWPFMSGFFSLNMLFLQFLHVIAQIATLFLFIDKYEYTIILLSTHQLIDVWIVFTSLLLGRVLETLTHNYMGIYFPFFWAHI